MDDVDFCMIVGFFEVGVAVVHALPRDCVSLGIIGENFCFVLIYEMKKWADEDEVGRASPPKNMLASHRRHRRHRRLIQNLNPAEEYVVQST